MKRQQKSPYDSLRTRKKGDWIRANLFTEFEMTAVIENVNFFGDRLLLINKGKTVIVQKTNIEFLRKNNLVQNETSTHGENLHENLNMMISYRRLMIEFDWEKSGNLTFAKKSRSCSLSKQVN